MTVLRGRGLVAVLLAGLALAAGLMAGAARGVGTGDPIITIAGTGTPGFGGDGGPAVAAQLRSPVAVAPLPDDAVLIADFNNHVVRRIGRDGIISTFAGTGQAGSQGDGGLATQALLRNPGALLRDPAGNVYIADRLDHRVRRVDPSGVITTFAGTGSPGSSGDGGPAAQARLNQPAGLARDAGGAIYVSELGGARVRRIGPDGIITTVAGTGASGFAGDGGPAVAARLHNPVGLAVDAAGNLLIADLDNNRVRNVGPDGVITTVAGTGAAGSAGDGGPAAAASLNRPTGLAVGAGGGIYVTEFAGARVRRVGPDGVISTVVGTGAPGGGGDGGPAGQATLNQPFGLALDRRDDLYVADSENHRVRRVHNTLPPVGAAGVRCAPVPPRAASRSSRARVALRPAQLLINQRISQAAVRRLNGVRAWLDAGISARDVCGGAIGPSEIGSGIVTETVAQRTALAEAAPRPVPVARPRSSGRRGRVTLSARQLLINQRVSQAAVRRANALEARLRDGLTGGDFLPGQIEAGHLASNLGIASVTPVATPPRSDTRIARARRGTPARVRLTATQLRINQRISQAAVRRANALIDRLSAGLTGAEIRDGTITSEVLSPALRAGP